VLTIEDASPFLLFIEATNRSDSHASSRLDYIAFVPTDVPLRDVFVHRKVRVPVGGVQFVEGASAPDTARIDAWFESEADPGYVYWVFRKNR
jgi:hypothetical protein